MDDGPKTLERTAGKRHALTQTPYGHGVIQNPNLTTGGTVPFRETLLAIVAPLTTPSGRHTVCHRVVAHPFSFSPRRFKLLS